MQNACKKNPKKIKIKKKFKKINKIAENPKKLTYSWINQESN